MTSGRLSETRPQKNYRSHFGRSEQRGGDIGYVAAWGLYVNGRREDLLAEVPASGVPVSVLLPGIL
jgi:hypothetical protein